MPTETPLRSPPIGSGAGDILREVLTPLLPEGLTTLHHLCSTNKPAPAPPTLSETLELEIGQLLGATTAERVKLGRRSLTARQLEAVLKAQEENRAQYQARIGRILADAEKKGPLLKDQLLARFERAARESLIRSHGLGFSTTGIGQVTARDPQFAKYLADRLQHERSHFTDFLTKVWDGSEIMPRERRQALYGRSADSFFYQGAVAGLPSTIVIDWALSPAEHCLDCISMSADGPYSKPGIDHPELDPLPFFPRSGNTQCLGNCKCRLIFRTEDQVDITPRHRPGRRILVDDETGQDVTDPDPGIQKQFDDLDMEMQHANAMYAMTGDKDWLARRRDANRRLIELQEKHGLRAIPTAKAHALEESAIEAVEAGLDPVLPEDSRKLTPGMFGGIVSKGDYYTGTLTEWDRRKGSGIFTSDSGANFDLVPGDEPYNIGFMKGLKDFIPKGWSIPPVPGATLLSPIVGFQASYAETYPRGFDPFSLASAIGSVIQAIPRAFTFNSQFIVSPGSLLIGVARSALTNVITFSGFGQKTFDQAARAVLAGIGKMATSFYLTAERAREINERLTAGIFGPDVTLFDELIDLGLTPAEAYVAAGFVTRYEDPALFRSDHEVYDHIRSVLDDLESSILEEDDGYLLFDEYE